MGFRVRVSFYRATLCVSTVFAVARCPSICMSACLSDCVCLSITLVCCIQTAEDIVKFLGRPGSSIILVSCLPAPVTNSKGNPSVGAQNTRGWKKICDFRLTSYGTKRYEIGLWLSWNVNRKSYALYRMVTYFQWPWRTQPGFQGHNIFEVEYLNIYHS